MENEKNVEQNNVPESIWAPGIPAKIEESDKITGDELADMAITYVLKNNVIPNGFKIEPGFPRKQVPNIICKRDGVVYGIMVVPSAFPAYVTLNDDFRHKFYELCTSQNVIPLFAPVGYMSIDEERGKHSILLKGDVFKTSFMGYIKVTNDPVQDFKLSPENLWDGKDPNADKED